MDPQTHFTQYFLFVYTFLSSITISHPLLFAPSCPFSMFSEPSLRRGKHECVGMEGQCVLNAACEKLIILCLFISSLFFSIYFLLLFLYTLFPNSIFMSSSYLILPFFLCHRNADLQVTVASSCGCLHGRGWS
jgi:hypothetical protein